MRMWGCAKRRISDVKSDDNENADVRPYLVRFYNLIFFGNASGVGIPQWGS